MQQFEIELNDFEIDGKSFELKLKIVTLTKMPQALSIFDILLPPLYLLGALAYGYYIKNKYIRTNPEYKYFIPGLLARIVGAIALGLVYFFYYGGGDTTNYHHSAVAYSNFVFTNKEDFLIALIGDAKHHYFSFEVAGDVYHIYRPNDQHAFFVVRLLIPIVLMGFQSYFASAILTAIFTYGGLWKLYQTFIQEFPSLRKEMAIACLFIPSCVFWGSGLMKDSFTLSAVGWFTYAFYNLFIKKQVKPKYIVYLIIASFIIIAIKPYIFFALLPGSILWLSNSTIARINHKFIRGLLTPLFLGAGLIGGYFALAQLGENLGAYQLDSVLDKAVVVQKDMKASYYGGQSYDIGDFDASAGGVALKAPSAIFAGIFRPGIWDVRNPVMAVSSLENTYLLILTLFLLFKLKFFGFFKYIGANPLILFSVCFSLFFAFSVGLTCANFGSLVRLRIPELPFFVASLFAIKYHYEQIEKNRFKSATQKKKQLNYQIKSGKIV